MSEQPTIQDLLDVYRQAILIEFERKTIEEQRLQAERKAEEHARRRAAAVEELLSHVGRLTQAVEQSNDLMFRLATQYPISDAVQELASEVRQGTRQTNDILELLLEINRLALVHLTSKDKAQKEQIFNLLKRSDKITLHKRLEIYHSNLNLLLEREAKFGGNAPLDLQNQIRDIREKIKELELQFEELEE